MCHNTHNTGISSTFNLYTLDQLDSFNKLFSTKVWILSFSLSIPGLKLKQENSKQSQVSELIENCLQAYRGHAENVIPHAFFDAAEIGNIEFLVKLIRFDFDLLWCTRENKSIFHIAVEKRHENIFNLLKEIGSIGDLIIYTTEKDGSNILHLAARLAPQEKLNAISGAALQMQQEILWFKVHIRMLWVVSFETFHRMFDPVST